MATSLHIRSRCVASASDACMNIVRAPVGCASGPAPSRRLPHDPQKRIDAGTRAPHAPHTISAGAIGGATTDVGGKDGEPTSVGERTSATRVAIDETGAAVARAAACASWESYAVMGSVGEPAGTDAFASRHAFRS